MGQSVIVILPHRPTSIRVAAFARPELAVVRGTALVNSASDAPGCQWRWHGVSDARLGARSTAGLDQAANHLGILSPYP